MTKITRFSRLNIFIAILIILGIFLAPATPTQAEKGPKAAALKIRGKTIGQWSAKWWQWAMSIPAESTPLQGGGCDQ